jgi:hypothetical protein
MKLQPQDIGSERPLYGYFNEAKASFAWVR